MIHSKKVCLLLSEPPRNPLKFLSFTLVCEWGILHIHGDRSADLSGVCIEMRDKNEKRREDTRAHSFLSLQRARERKHSHVMMEFAPSLHGRTIARSAGAPPRAHINAANEKRERQGSESKQLSPLKDEFREHRTEE